MKEIIKEIIRSNQKRQPSNLKERDIEIPVDSGKIIVIIGPRRCGKSSLLHNKIKELIQNDIKKEKIIFINFEDERLNFDHKNLDLILQAYRELYPDIDLNDCYFFFDEIQKADGWERFVNRVYEHESKNIFLTGSNAKLLSKEISTVLRGRSVSYKLYPLNFKEYLSFRNINKDLYDKDNKPYIINAFDNFLKWGGFPEIITMKEPVKIKTLQEYLNVMIYRDLVERYAVRDIHILKYFIKKVMANIAKPLSVNRIYNELKSNKYTIGKNTLYQFLEYINDIFLAVFVHKFDYSEIRREQLEKKAYIIDNGLLSAVDYNLSRNYGKLFENLIALELQNTENEFFFYRSHNECDFIIGVQDKYLPLQVCYMFNDESTKNREIKGLLAACNELNCKQGYIITLECQEEMIIEGIKIHIEPAYHFLLSNLFIR